jgi:putative tryptophan/tyrosine transport system substrate-binding protein
MKRREFITLLSGAAAWPLAARTQQLKVAQIGVLVLTNADGQSLTRELRLGLRDLGYSEGQNFVFQLRSSDGDPAIGIMDPCCLPSGRNCLFQAGKTTSR